MHRLSSIYILLFVAILLAASLPCQAQYILPYDTLEKKQAKSDSLAKTDTIDVEDIDTSVGQEQTPQQMEAEGGDSRVTQIRLADLWVRRLVMRGWLDTSHIGAFARYQLTSWGQGIGSYGPIEARLTVYYLGSTEWLGKDAEWLQVAVQTIEDEPTLIEYDLIVPSKPKVDDFYRVLYRVDRGDVKTGNFKLPENIVDYDQLDQPTEEGSENLEFYSGIFETEVFHGSGINGADVYLYRAEKLPPLGIVVLGYGDEALTFTSSGTDAAPRFYSPPPPPSKK